MAIRLTIRSGRDPRPQTVHSSALSLRIGRDADCDIRLPYPVVSGHHLTLFSADGMHYQIRDEGSTNGTRLDGVSLAPGDLRPVGRHARVQIVDLDLMLDVDDSDLESLPIAHTRTLIQEMLDGDGFAHDLDIAHFIVTGGPSKNKRANLTESFDGGELSSAPDAFLCLAYMPGSVRVDRDGDYFQVEPGMRGDGALANSTYQPLLNGEPLLETRPIRSGDKIRVGEHEIDFIDPLEHLLLEMGDKLKKREPAEEKSQQKSDEKIEDSPEKTRTPSPDSNAPSEQLADTPEAAKTMPAPTSGESSRVQSVKDPHDAAARAEVPSTDARHENHAPSWHVLDILFLSVSAVLVSGVLCIFAIFLFA